VHPPRVTAVPWPFAAGPDVPRWPFLTVPPVASIALRRRHGHDLRPRRHRTGAHAPAAKVSKKPAMATARRRHRVKDADHTAGSPHAAE